MTRHIRTLAETYAVRDGLYTPAAYVERPGYRFVHDAKRHRHKRLAATLHAGDSPYALRHWTIQDIYDSAYGDRMLDLARDYGMNGIQWSGDHIYWVNDALYRYNVYAHVGELCEKCHDRGLKAYFWTHEINDFFHEFVKNGKYGYSGQMADGKMDLSSKSGYWKVLEDKYDVFFRRMPGVDGLVLTLNECHVPVFREGLIDSDLPAEERVAKIARTVARVCARYKKHLILRTFCYFPNEQEKIRRGIARIGEPVTLMLKCQPHDWHVFFPHDPLIAALTEYERVVEYDLALEFMGDGRQPAPQVDYLKYRMDHAAANGVTGVAGRICRFRNHAEGTLNWANVYAFSRLAHEPAATADAVWRDYARADWGRANTAFIADAGRRLFEIGKAAFYLAGELRGVCNFNTFPSLDNWWGWNRVNWERDNPEVAREYALLGKPTPEFIAEVARGKRAARADIKALRREAERRRATLAADDAAYLVAVLERSEVMTEVFTTQHEVELMVRHDAKRPRRERRYGTEIAAALARLRTLARTKRRQVLDAGAEGNQYNDMMIEVFCSHAEEYLRTVKGRRQ
jgi:hypothetical protein